MSIADYLHRNIPEYYDTMYLDGYTPTEIYIAFTKQRQKELAEKDITDVNIESAVDAKWEQPMRETKRRKSNHY